MKQYVDVIVYHTKEGNMRPEFIVWDNQARYSIDRILEVKRAASLKNGGSGIRYTCRIHGHIRYLYYDVNRWFIEK